MATEAAPQTVESRLHAPEVTIVIPLLNEQATVVRLWEGIDRTLADSGIAAEVIFIDDGSTDGTMALLEELHERDPRVRVVSFKRNFGQHPAMHAGIARARGRIVVTMDGDLQNQPSDLPKLVAAIHAGADVASGWRG
jgi:glycosyltransferase involved in cell wall biosynthesis